MTIYRSLVKIYNLIIFQKCWCFFLFSLKKKKLLLYLHWIFYKTGVVFISEDAFSNNFVTIQKTNLKL